MSDVRVVDLLSESYADRLQALLEAINAAMADEQKLAARESPSGRTLDEIPDSVRLAEQYETLRAEAIEDCKANRRHVEMRLDRKAWRTLKEKHPPRTGEGVSDEDAKLDKDAGLNVATADDDLICAAVVEPVFSSRGDFDEWLDSLTIGQSNVLSVEAWKHANGARYNPKALPDSLTRSFAAN